MKDWTTLLSSYLNSAVHTAPCANDAAIVQEAAIARGLDFSHVDLRDVEYPAQLFTAIASALEFPEYFGMNWDAVYDCLTDMSWRPAAGYVLFLVGLRSLCQHPEIDVALAERVLESATLYWRDREVAFFVILAD